LLAQQSDRNVKSFGKKLPNWLGSIAKVRFRWRLREKSMLVNGRFLDLLEKLDSLWGVRSKLIDKTVF
jgi:hypothetical protein